MPRFLRRYTTPLFNAPITHISAFLVLHELTAVVPLFGLAGVFHYTQWLPSFIYEWKLVAEGVEKLGKYARRKGWLRQEDQNRFEQMEHEGEWTEDWKQEHGTYRKLGGGGTKILVEFATAYAITKALLPLRVMLSVWATPWFAATVLRPFHRVLPRSAKADMAAQSVAAAGLNLSRASPAAGTNAIGGGVTTSRLAG